MKRNIQSNLIEWKQKKDRKPLLLKGARQVGKTYCLQNFGKELFAWTHYFNFEKNEKLSKVFENDLDPKRIINELSFVSNRSINIQTDLVIFDEIQNCPKALTSLKYFCEEMKELALCSAGSLLGIHLANSSFPVGKVDMLDLFPMSFCEFLEGIGDNNSSQYLQSFVGSESIPEVIHSKIWEQLKIYFIVGGLPEVVGIYRDNQNNPFEALNHVRNKQNELIIAYNADMAKHSGKLNAMHIERLFRNIPNQLAKEQDESVSRFRFNGIIPGINRYKELAGPIDWLKMAGLIHKVKIVNHAEIPLSAFTKENIFKLYFFDVGILGAISNLPIKTILDYEYGTYKGYFAENFVLQEFISTGRKELHSWREGSAELEFLIEHNGEILPIEVKSGSVTQSKSLKMYSQKYNPNLKTIMSARNYYFDKEKKTLRYPIYLAWRFPVM